MEDAQDTKCNADDKGRPALPVNPRPQKMDGFEKEEVKKSRPVSKT